ncbi:MAG TPA: hypothetical protein VMG10_06280 [Gemmataceae bacterium]|nr:hypothetical protein [Gemmataceae bacterium]
MNRFNRIVGGWGFLLSLLLLAEVARPAWAADKKPVRLDILLPEDAQLEVNGYKTRSTGQTRRFESPLVQIGRTYRYSLKIVWQGHTLTRRIEVRPEHPLTLDLRKDLQTLASPPKPAGSFALLAPPALMLRADQYLVFPLRVKRFDFPGTIRIRFEDLPRGITVPEVKLSEGQSESNAMLFAAADAPHGTHEIRVAAASGDTKDVATIKVIVAKPEKKETTIENKPEKKPAAPPKTRVEHKPELKQRKSAEPGPKVKPAPTIVTKPRSNPTPGLCVLSPSRAVLHPGETKYVEIKAAMKGHEPLPAEPSIALVASPESKLVWEMWTAFDFKISQADRTVGFALKASAESEPREQQVRVLVAAGTLKTEHTITVTVQPRERKPVAKTDPIAPVQLIVPAGVELRKGRTSYVEMQVKTADGSPLSEAPSVMLESPSGACLRFVPWTSSFKAGEPACTVGIAVTAETNARTGDRDVRIRAVSGRSTAERPLRVTVVADR